MTSPELKALGVQMLHIIPGYRCNLECAHCCVNSGPSASGHLSPDVIKKLADDIQLYKASKLLFTGGEPTLYIDTINKLIEAHPNRKNCVVQITSNGWYSRPNGKGEGHLISKILEKFLQLDHLQLSYDVFHGSTLNGESISNLERYCLEKKIRFNVSICLSSPLDLAQALKIKDANKNVKIIFQKVESCGRARRTNSTYKYPSFENEVLKKKCPNLGGLSFIPDRGFSVCCSNLVFNHPDSKIAHRSVEEHTSSAFYKEISTYTFGEIMENRGIQASVLRPEHSSPCALCEYIYTNHENATE